MAKKKITKIAGIGSFTGSKGHGFTLSAEASAAAGHCAGPDAVDTPHRARTREVQKRKIREAAAANGVTGPIEVFAKMRGARDWMVDELDVT